MSLKESIIKTTEQLLPVQEKARIPKKAFNHVVRKCECWKYGEEKW
jgi:hypothetical protein